MVYNILNGDSLAFSFPATDIEGEIIVVREALIEGELSGDNLPDFWKSRARYLGLTDAEYNISVVEEFAKMMNAPDDSSFNLWFEYDLFCQVNLWFVLAIINGLPINKKVYLVLTSYLNRHDKHFWNGFGPATKNELIACYDKRILLGESDIRFGEALWTAYKAGNLEELMKLSKHQSPAFPYLKEVVEAHVDRHPKNGEKGRPEKVIEDIITNVSTDFDKVCQAFWKRESIYGFGDSQIQRIYEKVMRDQLS